MRKFYVGIGATWLVCQDLGDEEVVNSCGSYDEAVLRAERLAEASPTRPVFVYELSEEFSVEVSPVKRKVIAKAEGKSPNNQTDGVA